MSLRWRVFQNGKSRIKEKDVIKLRPFIRLVHLDTILLPLCVVAPLQSDKANIEMFLYKTKKSEIFYTISITGLCIIVPTTPELVKQYAYILKLYAFS